MFKSLRKKDMQMEESSVIELLAKGEYGVLSTTGSDGYPYGVPLSYVYFDNALYFHGGHQGHKQENLQANDKVSFCVVGKTEVVPEKFTTNYQSVIVFGRTSVVTGEEKLAALGAFIDKYCLEYSAKGKEIIAGMEQRLNVVKLSIEHISGKQKA